MMRRRLCAVLLALALCVSALPGHARAEEALEDFTDLDRTAWYAQGVRFCLKNGLMGGYGYRTRVFYPNGPITRAQFVTILWRMAGEPKAGLAMQYLDVPDDAWYAEAARWALAENIMGGYNAAVFAPDDPVTREQVALLLWRFTGYCNGEVPSLTDPEYECYGDRDEVSGDAAEAMQWACALGIVAGYLDRYGNLWLMPWANISRAAVATVLMRYCLDMGMYE